MEYILEFDGSCEPINPGGVPAYGWSLYRNGRLVKKDGYVVPEYLFCYRRTNNTAEFYALIEGLSALGPYSPGALRVRGDSSLVINCVSGKWRTRADHLKPLKSRARFLIGQLQKRGFVVSLDWIPREKNSRADNLSKGN